jgi:hypothetical protein
MISYKNILLKLTVEHGNYPLQSPLSMEIILI